MKYKWIAAGVVAAAVAVAGFTPKVLATPASGQSTNILAKAVLNELNLHSHTNPANRWGIDLQTRGMTDFYVVDNKFAPGGTTGWHSHPGPSLIVVVSGTITNYDSGNANCAGADYSAGQSFVDSGDDVHMLRNNGSATAETIAVQFVPADINRRIDESAPVNCT